MRGGKADVQKRRSDRDGRDAGVEAPRYLDDHDVCHQIAGLPRRAYRRLPCHSASPARPRFRATGSARVGRYHAAVKQSRRRRSGRSPRIAMSPPIHDRARRIGDLSKTARGWLGRRSSRSTVPRTAVAADSQILVIAPVSRSIARHLEHDAARQRLSGRGHRESAAQHRGGLATACGIAPRRSCSPVFLRFASEASARSCSGSLRGLVRTSFQKRSSRLFCRSSLSGLLRTAGVDM